MTALGDRIAKARKYAHLDARTFARLAELDETRLTEIESGASAATLDEAQRCARVFGVRLADLPRDLAASAPMRVLLRSAFDEGRPALDALIETKAIRELGAFQQVVLDAAELEPALSPALPRGFSYEDPEREARSLRLRLGLGMDPIPSMRRLLASLGVRIFFTEPDRLDRAIDGASTDWPRPAILVNLVGGGQCFWRTRMTLAHELAHLLFDMGAHRTLFSPHTPSRSLAQGTGRWRLFEGFDDIEAHADAFAACFLAPGDAVREAVGETDPTTEAAIAAVGARFGVGRTVAINRLQHTFRLSPEDRVRMETREERAAWTCAVDDVVAPEELGLRAGVLRELVATALKEGRIGAVRAREVLALPLTRSLDLPGLDAAAQTAPVSPEAAVRLRVAEALARRHPEAELAAASMRREGGGWRVGVVRGEAGDRSPASVGSAWVGDDGRIELTIDLPT